MKHNRNSYKKCENKDLNNCKTVSVHKKVK